jgi:hypothetical protein
MILTCDERKHFFYRIISILIQQIKKNNLEDKVSILVNKNKIKNIGLKRNQLCNIISSDYCAFIDDDDIVSDNYVNIIVKNIINTNNIYDVIGFNFILIFP